MTQKRLEKYPKGSSSTSFREEHDDLISTSDALRDADKKRKEMTQRNAK